MRRRTIWLASLFALLGLIPWLVVTRQGLLLRMSIFLKMPIYIFTPSSLTGQDTLEEMRDLLSGLHARFIEIDAKEHDRVTSQISHFPHILASSLMEQTAVYAQEHEMARRFAAGGFLHQEHRHKGHKSYPHRHVYEFPWPDVAHALG